MHAPSQPQPLAEWHHGPLEVLSTGNADLEMIAGNCHMRAMLPQLCLAAHILCSLPEVLTHQQDHNIHQRLGAVLAEEAGTPVQHLLLQASMNRWAMHQVVSVSAVSACLKGIEETAAERPAHQVSQLHALTCFASFAVQLLKTSKRALTAVNTLCLLRL